MLSSFIGDCLEEGTLLDEAGESSSDFDFWFFHIVWALFWILG